ncbi:hypothetical protein ACFL6D_04090 [Spirochaetota bacterium]
MKAWIIIKKYGLYVVVFLLGIFIGMHSYRVIGKGFLHRGKGKKHGYVVKWIGKKLDLNDEQMIKAREIIDRSYEEMRLVKERSYPEYKRIKEKVFDELELILDEEQKVKLKEMRENYQKKHEKWKKKE